MGAAFFAGRRQVLEALVILLMPLFVLPVAFIADMEPTFP